MANRKTIRAVATVLITIGYCSRLLCQDQHLNIESVTNAIINQNESGNDITLDDLFISVKTTQHYQYTRLPIILKTWFQLAKEQIWFFTDIENPRHQNETNGHMVHTKCPTSHSIGDLCCKMGYEYDFYLTTNKKWFCHFDDDNYVNVPNLLAMLRRYNYNEDWYLGLSPTAQPYSKKLKSKKYTFWYGTGGAGICLSRGIANTLLPFISDGKFKRTCEVLQLPDDSNLGFIIHLLGINLTTVLQFHSHCQKMGLLPPHLLKNQVSLSYKYHKDGDSWNVLNIPGFDLRYDPTRFLSLHCMLFRHFPMCSNFPPLLVYKMPVMHRPGVTQPRVPPSHRHRHRVATRGPGLSSRAKAVTNTSRA